ncbi:MAG: DUF1571 domain-containing protein [Planctomycetaceae bacterium]|nr:DUF1571 domain-containing protein [Planctomycetaceae bacterium]
MEHTRLWKKCHFPFTSETIHITGGIISHRRLTSKYLTGAGAFFSYNTMKNTEDNMFFRTALAGLFGAALCCSVFIQQAVSQSEQGNSGMKVANTVQTVAPEHPLAPVIAWAERERPKIAKIADYTAIITKQENVNGEVQGAQVMEVKVRHEPFSVYLKFRYPKELNGQEAIYVKGANDDKLIGHGVGLQKTFGTQKIPPNGFIAMRGNKYPITEMGILNLVDRLLDVGYKDAKYGECEVKYYENLKVDERPCTLIQVTHPVPRKNFIFHIARIFVDDELQIPIRYDSFSWPEDGKEPVLIEAYIYRNIKLNAGLTDLDFDYRNPAYGYAEGKK